MPARRTVPRVGAPLSSTLFACGPCPVRTGSQSNRERCDAEQGPSDDHRSKEKHDAKEHRDPGARRRDRNGRHRRGRHARTRRRNRVQPPRGAAHRGRPRGGHHGRLRVPEPGQAEHRHDPGQRDPGRGSRRRPAVLHVLAQRSLQPEDRHHRRRPAGRHLPVPVPAEDRSVLPRRHRAAVHGDADREGEVDRRRPRDDPAEQHRQALDSELSEPGREVGRLVRRRRLEGVRRPARRSVLRRHRSDLRPRRDPQGDGEHGRREGLLRRLRRPHVRCAGSHRRARGEERDGRCLGLRRPAEGDDSRRLDP